MVQPGWRSPGATCFQKLIRRSWHGSWLLQAHLLPGGVRGAGAGQRLLLLPNWTSAAVVSAGAASDPAAPVLVGAATADLAAASDSFAVSLPSPPISPQLSPPPPPLFPPPPPPNSPPPHPRHRHAGWKGGGGALVVWAQAAWSPSLAAG